MDIMFNGRKEAQKNIARIVASLSDPGLITEKGGFIFKSQISEDTFRFGILPSFLDGERTYHYNIDVGEGLVLTGFINPNSSMTIVFNLKPEQYKLGVCDNLKSECRRQYIALANFLMEHGFPPDFRLDQISSDIIEKTGISDRKISCVGDILTL